MPVRALIVNIFVLIVCVCALSVRLQSVLSFLCLLLVLINCVFIVSVIVL